MIAEVDVFNICIGSPFLVDHASFDTVTPEVTVRFAPELSFNGE